MDGSWTADGELSHGGADNTPSQALANTNDVYIQCGKVITESLHCKVSVKDYYFYFMNTEYDTF